MKAKNLKILALCAAVVFVLTVGSSFIKANAKQSMNGNTVNNIPITIYYDNTSLNMTRAHFIKELHSALDLDFRYFVKPEVEAIYKDVKESDDYSMALYDLYSSGIIDDKDYFRPSDIIVRQELAHYIVNAYCYKYGVAKSDIKYTKRELKDADLISKEYADDVQIALELNLMKLISCDTFCPVKNVTKEEGLKTIENLK